MEDRILSEEMLMTAKDLQRWRWQTGKKPGVEPPGAAILCLQPDLLRRARRKHPLKRVRGLFGDGYLLNNRQGKIALAGGFGLGAPAMAILVEEYVAFGVRRFLSIGVAGTLQPHLQAGDVVVCDSAIRGEGTSHRYLPPARRVKADSVLVSSLRSGLAHQGLRFCQGVSWTTDTPYRETRREADTYRKEGILTVEMEAAALFAAARALGAQAAAVFVIADRLLPEGWEPPLGGTIVKKNLEAVLEASVRWLAAAESSAEAE
jgi:uridine phosphorylase